MATLFLQKGTPGRRTSIGLFFLKERGVERRQTDTARLPNSKKFKSKTWQPHISVPKACGATLTLFSDPTATHELGHPLNYTLSATLTVFGCDLLATTVLSAALLLLSPTHGKHHAWSTERTCRDRAARQRLAGSENSW